MSIQSRYMFAGSILLATLLCGCATNDQTKQSSDHGSESRVEHAREPSQHDGVGEEESATQYSLTETCNVTRHGARLILAYHAGSHTFRGTLSNPTIEVLRRVRAEVHLSNGVELGPSGPKDLAPGETLGLQFAVKSTDFETWSAHPEVGDMEHNHDEHE